MGKKSAIVSGYGFAMQLGATMDEIRRAQGVTEEEFHIIGTPEGRPHLEKMISGLKFPKIPRGALMPPIANKQAEVWISEFFSLLSCGEGLIIDALDGKEVLADSSDVFAYIDSDFRNWDADERGEVTAEVAVEVHELVKDGTFIHFFVSVSVAGDGDLNKLCLTQAQIKNFVVKHRNWLRKDGYATFFLFKSRGMFFVAHVCFCGGGRLEVRVDRFEYGSVWHAARRHRVVFPQLAV